MVYLDTTCDDSIIRECSSKETNNAKSNLEENAPDKENQNHSNMEEAKTQEKTEMEVDSEKHDIDDTQKPPIKTAQMRELNRLKDGLTQPLTRVLRKCYILDIIVCVNFASCFVLPFLPF